MSNDAPSSRRLRFFIPGAVLLVLLLAIVFFAGTQWHRARQTQRLIDRIENELGGDVGYEYGPLGELLMEWTGGALPVRGRPVEVNLTGCAIGDEFLDELAVLPHLSMVTVWDTPIGDEGLRLGRLERLTDLDLDGTRITDAGLQHLRGLKWLESLDLGNTRITGRGLRHLEGLDGLETLVLTGANLTDEDLRHLPPLSRLESLRLCNVCLDGSGLPHLAALPALKSLDLDGCPLSDAALEGIAALKGLTMLSLRETPVTVDGLRRLEGLTGLETLFLDIGGPEITDDELARLQEARPDLFIGAGDRDRGGAIVYGDDFGPDGR